QTVAGGGDEGGARPTTSARVISRRGQVSPPRTHPSPRPRWEASGRWRAGDGRSKSGLQLHSASDALFRGGDGVPPADPPLSSATLGGVWKVARRGRPE